MIYTPEQLQEEFNRMPDELQEYIMSNGVYEAVNTLAEWFSITKLETYRQAVLMLCIGLWSGDDFIQFVREELGLSIEDAANLFGEIGDRILDQANTILEKAIAETRLKEQNPKNDIPEQVVSGPSVIPSTKVPVSENRRFVGVPFYGVEKPASSYTSILPRSNTEANKPKDTPTVESLLQKVAAPTGKPENKTSSSWVPTKVPATNAPPKNLPGANLPVLESQEPSFQLSKLVLPTNIPRQESKQEIKIVQQPAKIPTPTSTPVPKPPTQIPAAPIAPVVSKPAITIPTYPPPKTSPTPPPTPPASVTPRYTSGQDPYREAPTP